MMIRAHGDDLTIDGKALTGLLAHIGQATGGTPVADELDLLTRDELRDAGALDATGRPAGTFADTVTTMAIPWARSVVKIGGTSDSEHHLWFGPRAVVTAADQGDGEYLLRTTRPTAAAAALLRVTQLGARRHGGLPTARLRVPESALRGAATLAAALPAGPLRTAVENDRWRLVTIECEWAPMLTQGEPEYRGLAVIDTPEGPLTCTPDTDVIILEPTMTGRLWPTLIELARPPAGIDLTAPYAAASAQPVDIRF